MDDRWTWAEEIWRRSFEPLERLGLALERVDRQRYWKIHDAELERYFPPEVFIDTEALRTEAEVAGQARLAASRADHALADFCVVREGERVAATFCGYQKSEGRYRMWHSHVHPDFRRRGIYGAYLAATIAYTRELGFDTIVSEHAPSNNPILVAKLSAGFRITGLEIAPPVGLSVVLTYFHNEDQLAAYEFRCGMATLNPRIVASGSVGAMPLLRRQLGGGDADE